MSVWSASEIHAHVYDDCPSQLILETFGLPGRLICGCGAVAAHSPMAVARAELEAECPEPLL